MNVHASTKAERARPVHIGDHLREWRQRRHLSQLDLAGDAEISARHLSFVETGRAAPSREMVLKLAERLDVPLRERNVLLVAAGFAPAFPQRSLDDPALKSARQAIDLVLKAHEPNPALAYRPALESGVGQPHGGAAARRRSGAAARPALQHPAAGVSPRGAGAAHRQSRRMGRASAGAAASPMRGDRRSRTDQALSGSEGYPIPARAGPLSPDNVAIPFKLRHEGEVLSFISTTMVFGTPVDITLSELALETFFPADDLTAGGCGRWLPVLK